MAEGRRRLRGILELSTGLPQLAEADAVIFGTPTRFGNMAAQM